MSPVIRINDLLQGTSMRKAISVKCILTLLLLMLTAAMVYCVYDGEEMYLSLNDRLMVAASSGDLDGCKELLGRGASVLARDSNGSTPLMCAAGSGRVEIVRLLMDAGSDVAANDRFDMTALLYAVRGGSVPTVALLLSYGADAGSKATWRDQWAISYAEQCGSDAVAEFLRARQKVVPAAYLPPRGDRRGHSMPIGS
jgi:hypothetical protein